MQLRYSGVLQAVQVSRAGFPDRLSHTELLQRYRVMTSSAVRGQPGHAEALAEARAVTLQLTRAGVTVDAQTARRAAAALMNAVAPTAIDAAARGRGTAAAASAVSGTSGTSMQTPAPSFFVGHSKVFLAAGTLAAMDDHAAHLTRVAARRVASFLQFSVCRRCDLAQCMRSILSLPHP